MTHPETPFFDRTNILYVADLNVARDSGAGVNEREFVATLNRRFGTRAFFVIPSSRPSLGKELGLDASRVSILRPPRKNNPFSYLRYWYQHYAAASKAISRNRIGFLILRLNLLPFPQWLIARKYRLPFGIKTLGAGMIGNLKKKIPVLGHVADWVNDALVRRMVKLSTGIDVCTVNYHSYFTELFKLAPPQIKWIENSTNIERFTVQDKTQAREKRGLSRFNPVIGLVGGRPSERGGLQLIEAGRYLTDDFPGIGIVIVGHDDNMASLTRRAAELGIADRCVFPGLVPYAEVVDYINAFDVGVAFDTGERLKAWGNSSQKVRQYLACGKPIVSGTGGNEFLETQRLGTIVDSTKYREIAAAIRAWLELGPEETRAHAVRARKYAEENLSQMTSLNERLSFWESRLQGAKQ